MIIIGEKLNGAIPSVGTAIRNREAELIKKLAISQTEAGANYLDICAGTEPDQEYDALAWMLELVQSVSSLPICIDSPDPEMLLRVLPLIQNPGLINSVSGEGNKCELLFPFLRDNPQWNVVALTCDNDGIPATSEKKTEVASGLIEKAMEFDIVQERIFIDPLVLSVSTTGDSVIQFIDAIRRIRAKYPGVKFTSGLSNISFGMPERSLINRSFLILCLHAGMDSAIMDPTNRSMREAVMATEVLLGQDKYCRRYNSAYRAGKIGKVKTA